MKLRGLKGLPAALGAACLAMLLLSGAAALYAQEAQPQFVDSQNAYQKRIEDLINERLSTLLPNGNYVVHAEVDGQMERVPPAPGSGPNMDLPGFRPMPGEPVPGQTKFHVTRVNVSVILNQDVPPAELKYIRTIVPILADFRKGRGDTMSVEVIPPTVTAPPVAATAGKPPPSGLPLGLTPQDLLLIGVLAVLLLMLIVLMWRLAAPRRVEVAPAAPAPAPPPPRPAEPEMSAADKRRMEQEKQLDELRHGVVKRLFARPELTRDLVSEMAGTPNKLADLAHAFGLTIARQVLLPTLGREEYLALEQKVYGEQEPDLSRVINTLREANLFMMAQEIVNPEVVRPNPFRFLDALTWGQIAHLLRDEPVKIKAVVLSRLKPEDTARILETLPQEMQLEIAVNIGNLHDLALDMAESVAAGLSEKARHVPDARTVDIEGPSALVDLMGRTSTATSRYLLEAMRSKDARLSEEVEKRFFMFEAIPLVPDELLPQAVRTLPSTIIIQALQGASPDLQRKVIMAFPEQARTGLVTALRNARAEPDAVQDARRQVVAKFQELGRQGRIDLKQISDAWQAQAKAS